MPRPFRKYALVNQRRFRVITGMSSNRPIEQPCRQIHGIVDEHTADQFLCIGQPGEMKITVGKAVHCRKKPGRGRKAALKPDHCSWESLLS